MGFNSLHCDHGLLTPPFQGWDTVLRSLLDEVRILSVVLRLHCSSCWAPPGPISLCATVRSRQLQPRSCRRITATRSIPTKERFPNTRVARAALPPHHAARASARHLHRACWCTASTPNRVREGSNPSRCAIRFSPAASGSTDTTVGRRVAIEPLGDAQP